MQDTYASLTSTAFFVPGQIFVPQKFLADREKLEVIINQNINQNPTPPQAIEAFKKATRLESEQLDWNFNGVGSF